jgi:hypothetical protein
MTHKTGKRGKQLVLLSLEALGARVACVNAWCAEPVVKPQRKYCSARCRESAAYWRRPRTPVNDGTMQRYRSNNARAIRSARSWARKGRIW